MSQLLKTYLAHKLTEKRSISDPEKLNNSIRSANIDLNPHQVDAAIFAFKSPLSRGAILADEVGLGKTIEAGLIVDQLYTEGRRNILILEYSICERKVGIKFVPNGPNNTVNSSMSMAGAG